MEDMKDYIDGRIQDNYYKIREREDFKKLKTEFNTIYDYLEQKLVDTDKKTLEELYALINSINNFETILAYKIGLTDGIEIKKETT